MKEWLRSVWADVPVRVALVLVLLATILTWFVWPGRPLMEAIHAVAIAGLLLILMRRDLLGAESRAGRCGAAVAVVGLLTEAAFYLATDDRPLGVALVFPVGLLLLIGASVAEQRKTRASAHQASLGERRL